MRQIIGCMLEEKDDHRPLGKNWTTKFLQRHPELSIARGRTMDINRLTSLDQNIIETFFTRLSELRAQYDIEPDDLHI
jgi:hypothetical protein